jgi:predicted phosphodiesterase
MATLFSSDSHFGLNLPDAERIAHAVTSIVKDEKLGCTESVVAGDLIVGQKQQRENPDWNQHMQTDAGEWIQLLNERHSIIVAGNCEHQPQMDMLGRGQLPYLFYDEKTGVLVTHGHIAEPRSVIELIRNLPPAMVSHQRFARTAMEKLFGTKNEASFDAQGTVDRLRLAVGNDRRLQTILEKMDTVHHQTSANLYTSLTRFADIIPGIRLCFDAIVRLSLDDYYIRMLVHSVRELVKQGVILPPKTILYGHTHRPFIMNKAQLKNQFDFGEGWLPDWIVNDGTMVPLTEKNGGTKDSHFVIVGDNQVPMLYRTTDAPLIELVNVGGNPTSNIIDTAR